MSGAGEAVPVVAPRSEAAHVARRAGRVGAATLLFHASDTLRTAGATRGVHVLLGALAAAVASWLLLKLLRVEETAILEDLVAGIRRRLFGR